MIWDPIAGASYDEWLCHCGHLNASVGDAFRGLCSSCLSPRLTRPTLRVVSTNAATGTITMAGPRAPSAELLEQVRQGWISKEELERVLAFDESESP